MFLLTFLINFYHPNTEVLFGVGLLVRNITESATFQCKMKNSLGAVSATIDVLVTGESISDAEHDRSEHLLREELSELLLAPCERLRNCLLVVAYAVIKSVPIMGFMQYACLD